MRWDWRTALRVLSFSCSTGSTDSVPAAAFFAFIAVPSRGPVSAWRCSDQSDATTRCGEEAESKRLPGEDGEVFQVAIDLGCFVRLREQEALPYADVFELKSLTLFGVLDPRGDDLFLALLGQVHERVHEFGPLRRLREH